MFNINTPPSYGGPLFTWIVENIQAIARKINSATGSGDALTSNPLSQFADTTSTELAGIMPDAVGRRGSTEGFLVFNKSPLLDGIELVSDSVIIFSEDGGGTIGAEAAQKIGFWGNTPVIQPEGDIRTALASIGLVLNPLNSVEPLFDYLTTVGNTGSTDTELYTSAIAGYTITAAGEKIEFVYGGTYASTASEKKLSISFGSADIFTTGALVITGAPSWYISGTVIRTGISTARACVSFTVTGAPLSSYTQTTELTSVNFEAEIALKLKGQASNVSQAIERKIPVK